MIAWFARNEVVANLFLLAIVVAGYLSFSKIPLEVFPSFALDIVTVQTTLRGASPQDVERGVTIPIEEAMQDLEGIKKITSRTTEGLSVVRFELKSNYDAKELLADIKSRVDALNNLPSEIDNPITKISVSLNEVITVSLAGDVDERLLRSQVDIVRDELLQIPVISQVELSGVRDYEISIEISQNKLINYNLSIDQVAQMINQSSIDLSAGTIKGKSGEIFIRSRNQAYSGFEFENIPVANTSEGGVVRLGDIASIIDGFEENKRLTRFNGKPAALLEVYRVGDENAIEIATAVKDYIDKKNKILPATLTLSAWNDRSSVIKARISTLLNNALQGGILVLLLLGLFLRPAVAAWVFVGIPVSFTGAFIIMNLFGVTFNLISLFGFILVLGIVVDDAIVTGENIYSHLKAGNSGIDAAINGTHEIAAPVLFGVLTTVAAFLPLFFIEGARGAIFSQIPAVVIPVLLFSLLESKFILPSHLKHLRPLAEDNTSGIMRLQQKVAGGMEYCANVVYPKILLPALKHRVLVLVCFISLFMLIIAIIQSGKLRFAFFPKIASERISMSLTMTTGTSFEVTDGVIQKANKAVYELKEKYFEETKEEIIVSVMSISGSGGSSNTGRVFFEITSPEKRQSKLQSSDILKDWRKKIGDIPGAESVIYRAEFGRAGDPIDIQLSSNNVEALKELGGKVKAKVKTFSGVFDVVDSNSSARNEYLIELKPQARALGFTEASIARSVRNAFFGFEVQQIQRGRDEVRVFIRTPLVERQNLQQLEQLPIRASSGNTIPLSQLAILSPSKGLSTINRVDRFRIFSVRADVDKKNVDMQALNKELSSYLDDALKNYQGVYYSFEGEGREQQETFASLFVGLIVILFVIYTLLAIPFKSYVLPFVVMFVIPFGVIGAILGHLLMGMNLSIMSVMGMLALVGIVVNDSLVMVDFINKQAKSDHENEQQLFARVSVAGQARFRAVVLTSLTTFIGLMPLLFEKSTQAQFLVPMAVSLAFGILFATTITLVMVPMNYVFLNDFKRGTAWCKRKVQSLILS